MTRLEFRDHLSASLTWIAGGVCWTAQVSLPWTSAGVLSSSSQLDGFRLVRSGSVDAVAPTWSAYLLLVLPAIGLVLVGLAGLAGRGSARARVVLAGVGVVLVGLAVHALVAWDPSRLGVGGWTSVAGCALVVAACLLERTGADAPAPTLEVVS